MRGGLGMLMDVQYPDHSKGFRVVAVPGGGWRSPLALSARQHKAKRQVEMFGLRLSDAGYTVFAANHRTAPPNKGPAPLEDVGRVARFVCHHARGRGSMPSEPGAVGARREGT